MKKIQLLFLGLVMGQAVPMMASQGFATLQGNQNLRDLGQMTSIGLGLFGGWRVGSYLYTTFFKKSPDQVRESDRQGAADGARILDENNARVRRGERVPEVASLAANAMNLVSIVTKEDENARKLRQLKAYIDHEEGLLAAARRLNGFAVRDDHAIQAQQELHRKLSAGLGAVLGAMLCISTFK